MSGIDSNYKQLENIFLILVTLLVFHFEISGNDDNVEQPEIKSLKSLTFQYSILKYQANMIMMNNWKTFH